MTKLATVRAVGHAARQLPRALLRQGCASVQTVSTGPSTRRPVVLVHGYAGSESVWTTLRQELSHAGFGDLVSLNYNSFATDPNAVADEVTRQARAALERSGADGVHFVGHSLGGLIVRQAVERGGAAELATTVVTIATPHRGAALARIAPGRCKHLLSGPADDTRSLARLRRTRWVAYYSDGDRVVSTASARLDDMRFGAVNVLIPDCGHLTICRDPRLIRSLVDELVRSESSEPNPSTAMLAVREHTDRWLVAA